ncbi:MAG: GNAT family N-acetyltransferase, partial [Sphingomicrobium sp.]
MIIERATLSDLAALHALIESAYRGDSARQGWSHEADLLGGQRTDLAALEEAIADPVQTILIARDGDRLAGCVAIADRGGGIAYIGLVTVDPLRQAAGLGRRLLEAAEQFAALNFAANRAEMTVISPRHELIAWYERRGYT